MYVFLYEKMYSYYFNLKMSEDRLKKDIKDTISKVFGKELAKGVETF